jgi:hypothetical protein
MYGTLRLEDIGADHGMIRLSRRLTAAFGTEGHAIFYNSMRPRPWVARITGRDERYGYARQFMDFQRDYSRANSTGSRGVYLCYALPPGVYQVKQFLSWRSCRRYFCRVEPDGTLSEITQEEVDTWLDQSCQNCQDYQN